MASVPNEEPIGSNSKTEAATYRILPKRYNVNVYAKPDVQTSELEKYLEPLKHANDYDINRSFTTGDKTFYMGRMPYELRLGATFLDQLGRDSTAYQKYRTGEVSVGYDPLKPQEDEGIHEGIKPIYLKTPIDEMDDDHTIVISADTIEQYLKKINRQKVLTALPLHRVGGPSHGLGLDMGVAQVYGNKKFHLTIKEVKTLDATTRIRLGDNIPSALYMKMLAITSNTKENNALCNAIWPSWTKIPESERPDIPNTNLQFYNLRMNLSLSDIMEESDLLQDELGLLLKEVNKNPLAFGFAGEMEWNETKKLSMAELASEVVISQEGYFMHDRHTHISPKPKACINFVCAAGIDFNAPSELERYFDYEDINSSKGWKFKYKKEEALKERIRMTYDIIFTSCKAMEVTHPSFLAMGLGVYTKSIKDPDIKHEIALIYFKAQFELLSVNDYGFKVVYLNAGPNKAAVLNALIKGFPLKCPVIVHPKDVKSLSIVLAQAGKQTCFLNPTDPIFLMQGFVGGQWETESERDYSGDQDTVATSTINLLNYNITKAFSDTKRIVNQGSEMRVMEESNGTLRGIPPEQAIVLTSEQYLDETPLNPLLNSLADSILRHQPKDLIEHIIKWGLDFILKGWQAEGSSSMDMRRLKKDGKSKVTVTEGLRDEFENYISELRHKYIKDLELDELEAKQLWARRRKEISSQNRKEKELEEKKLRKEVSADLRYDLSKIVNRWKYKKTGVNYTPYLEDTCPLVWAFSNVNQCPHWIEEGRFTLVDEVLNAGYRPPPPDELAVMYSFCKARSISTTSFKKGLDIPLEWALTNHHWHLAHHLIDKGVDIDVRMVPLREDKGWYTTPLHLAIRSNEEKLCKKLIWLRCQLGIHDAEGNTPLHLALQSRLENVVKLLIQVVSIQARDNLQQPASSPVKRSIKGKDTKGKGKGKETDKATPPATASTSENGEGHAKFDNRLDLYTATGYAPIHLAMNQDRLDMAFLLIENKADINIQDKNRGNTPFHCAIEMRADDFAEELFNQNADWTIQNLQGQDCFHYAMKYNSTTIIELILQRDMDIQPQSEEKKPSCRHDQRIPWIIKMKDCVEKQHGNSYLHFAARYGHPDVVKCLIQAGYDMYKTNNLNYTPLEFINEFDLIHLEKFLDHKDYFITVKGAHDLHRRATEGNLQECRLLVQYNPQTVHELASSGNGEGITPLHCALHHNHPGVVQYLLANGGRKLENSEENVPLSHLKKEILTKSSSQLLDTLRAFLYPSESQSNEKTIQITRQAEEQARQLRGKEIDRALNLLRRPEARVNRHSVGVECLAGFGDKPVELYPPNYQPEKSIEQFFKDSMVHELIAKAMEQKKLQDNLVREMTLTSKQEDIQELIATIRPKIYDMLERAQLFATLKLWHRQVQRHERAMLEKEAYMEAAAARERKGLKAINTQLEGPGKETLSEDNIAAIYIYTFDLPIAQLLNEAIEGGGEKLRFWWPYLYHFKEGLDKLPAVDENQPVKVYLGLNDSPGKGLLDTPYLVSKKYRWTGFNIATRDMTLAEAQQARTVSVSRNKVMMIVNCMTPKDISEFSTYPEEEEVVFVPGTRFQVINSLSEATAKLLLLPAKIMELDVIP